MTGSARTLSVTFVIPYFYPAWQYGGQPRSAYELARALAKRGHRVKVLTTDSAGEKRLSRDQIGDGQRVIDGIEVIYYRNASNWLAFRQRLFWPAKLFRDIDIELAGADLLHIHELRSTLSVPAYRAARRMKVPYVLSTHGGLRHLGKIWIKRIFDAYWGRRILEDASVIIAISPAEEKDANSLIVDKARIQRLPNMLFVDEYPRTTARGVFRRKWGLNSRTIILFIGRLQWIKGIDLLIQAFKTSGLSQKSVHLVVAGNDDGQERELRGMVSTLGLDSQVTFTGFLDHTAKLQAFVDSDLSVVPSRSEVFAISAVESLLCECPVVLSDACGLHPAPQPDQGIRLFKSENVDDLARVLSNAVEDQSLKRAASAGRQFVIDNFASEGLAERAESIYRQAVRG